MFHHNSVVTVVRNIANCFPVVQLSLVSDDIIVPEGSGEVQVCLEIISGEREMDLVVLFQTADVITFFPATGTHTISNK